MQCQAFTLRLDNHHEGDLLQLNRFLQQAMPIQVSSSLVQGNPAFWSVLVFFEGQAPAVPMVQALAQKVKKSEPPPQTNDNPVFQALRTWRSQKAKEEGVPPYVIAHDAQLRAIAEAKPKTEVELKQVKGFGDRKIGKYGQEILEILSRP